MAEIEQHQRAVDRDAGVREFRWYLHDRRELIRTHDHQDAIIEQRCDENYAQNRNEHTKNDSGLCSFQLLHKQVDLEMRMIPEDER